MVEMLSPAARFARAFGVASLTAIVTIAFAVVFARAVGSDDLERHIDKNAQAILVEVETTRQLLCDLLRGADDPQIQTAHDKHCKGVNSNG